jgi:hypothetical protein
MESLDSIGAGGGEEEVNHRQQEMMRENWYKQKCIYDAWDTTFQTVKEMK